MFCRMPVPMVAKQPVPVTLAHGQARELQIFAPSMHCSHRGAQLPHPEWPLGLGEKPGDLTSKEEVGGDRWDSPS